MAIKQRLGPVKNRKPTLLLWVGFLLIAGASCQAETTPTADVEDLEQAPVVETAEPTATDDLDDMAEADQVDEEPVDQCLVCHTDQETLMDTASPVVDHESESSGEG